MKVVNDSHVLSSTGMTVFFFLMTGNTEWAQCALSQEGNDKNKTKYSKEEIVIYVCALKCFDVTFSHISCQIRCVDFVKVFVRWLNM